MRKILLSILTISALGLGANAQTDSTSYSANQSETLPPPIGTIPANHAAIQTLSGSNLRMTGDWTIEAWVKIGMPSLQIHIVEAYSTSGNNGGFALRLLSSKVQAFQITNQSTSSSNVVGTTTIPNGEWHHIAATLNETTQELKVYLDGALEGTTTTTLTTLNNNNGLYIGARGDDQQVSGMVEIDNVKIWNKAKTVNEIQEDTLACLTGNETDLLAWYDFEGTPSSTLVDKSTHGNNGTFVNFSSFNFPNRLYTCHQAATGIPENQEENILLYPNPTSSILTLNTSEQINSVNIIDITGKTVKTIASNSNTIDVSDLVKGIYFLQVQTDNGITNNKFIKE